MPPKVPKKGSKGLKKTKKGPKAKKTVQLKHMSDSDVPSESLLDPPGPTQQAGSDVEEGEEASQRPEAQATQDDPEDDDYDDGAPPRKKTNVSEQMTADLEQDLVEFFTAHPLSYDQTLKEFKDSLKKEHLLDERGAELGMTGGNF